MATIQETISIQDGMSAPLKTISTAATDAAESANKFASRVREAGVASSSSGGLISGLRSALGSVAGQFTVATIAANAFMSAVNFITSAPGRLMDMATEYNGLNSRLMMITGSQEEAAALNDRIYYSALRAHGEFDQMANSVSKIGLSAKETFKSADQIVPFVEGIQKLFTISGASATEMQNAMLQLTQSLGSGRLQGDEFRSIAEQAPLIESYIAEYMGVARGELKALASEGQITSDIIRDAILTNLDKINEQFAIAGTTWQTIFTDIRTVAQKAFQPVAIMVNQLAKSQGAAEFANRMKYAVAMAANAVVWLINNVVWLGSVVTQNWDIIAPILLLMSSYYVGIGAAALASGAQQVASNVMAAGAKMAHMVATFNLAAAQAALNAAFLACPVTWIVGGIVAIIGVIYLAVAVFNHFAGTSVSATGLIFAAFAALFNGIRNQVVFFMNMFLIAAQFIADVWRDPMAAVENLFIDIWNNILGLVGSAVNSIIEMIRAIPGMDKVIGGEPIDVTKSLQATRNEIEGSIAPNYYGFTTAGEAASYGYELGKGFGEGLFELPDMAGQGEEQGFFGDDTERMAEAMDDTGKNTGRTADAMERMVEMTAEEMRELRDVALQTTMNSWRDSHDITIKVDQNNTLSNSADIDGMTSSLLAGLRESVGISRERTSMA